MSSDRTAGDDEMLERGSDKSGPRLDDERKHETEGLVRSGHDTHVEEWKDPEPAGEDQPDARRQPAGPSQPGTPAGMSEGDVERRAELAAHLAPAVYPADRDQLRAVAEAQFAPDWVVGLLDSLPTDRSFDNLADVWVAAGGHVESHRF
jgi:hypothetical protein